MTAQPATPAQPAEAAFADGFWTSPDGLKLHYRDYAGRADRPVVLCLPGLTRNARDFEDVAARLAGSRKLWLALVVGLLVSAGVVDSALKIPHPTWMIVLGVALPPLLAWLAAARIQKGLASTK